MTWMLTASGAQVDLRFMPAEEIKLHDIAHHLAQLNRFTGACRRPYSVAEHSLLVAYLLEHVRGITDPHVLMAGLMHDAHEAYTADLSSPMKQAVGDAWHTVERRVQHAVRRRFNLRTAAASSRDLIRWADLTALSTEREGLMPPLGDEWQVTSTHPPATWDFAARDRFTWQDWRQCFIERFEELQFSRNLRAQGAGQ